MRTTADAPTQSVVCHFPSIDSAGTIPADVLTDFTGNRLDFFTYTSQLETVGDYRIEISVGLDVMTPDRQAAIVGALE